MNLKSEAIQISIVIPLFNEENNIKELYCRIKKVLILLNKSYEIIYVEDGSKDRTYEIIRDIQVKDSRVKIIKLIKNCGQSKALLIGFEFVKGNVIVTMDGDLQNDPNDIPKFLDKIKEGYDFVNGFRFKRNDPLHRKLVSKVANWLIKRKTKVALKDYGCAFAAAKRELIDKFKGCGRESTFIKPVLVKLANSVAEIKVSHHQRKKGVSKYSLPRITKSGLDFLFNFSLVENSIRYKNDIYCVIEKVIEG